MSENRPAPSATSDMPTVDPTPTPTPVPTPTPEPTPAVETTPTPTQPVSVEDSGPIKVRIGQIAAQRREAEARAERWERNAEEMRARLDSALAALSKVQAPTSEPPAPILDSMPRPNRESFPDNESFEAALVSWAGAQAGSSAAAEFRKRQEELDAQKAEQARAEEERKATALREEEESKRAEAMRLSWEERRAKAIEAHPDFSEVAEATSLPISVAMAHVIVNRPDGPEIAYYLGKNPGEAARIAAIVVPGQVFPNGHPQAGLPVPNYVEQAFELGKIAATKLGVSAPTEAQAEAPTNNLNSPAVASSVVPPSLPAPPSPISGASAEATTKSTNDMSMEEYAARRISQLQAERRPGRVH